MRTYFDHNATAPLCPAAREAWLEAADRYWHNPSGLYREAGAARRRLEEAREELAERLGAEPERVVFNSGATEANNAVITWMARRPGRKTVAISAIEHPSVREPARREFGAEGVVEIVVGADEGAINLAALAASLDNRGDELALVSVMAANNETGVLQPWREAALLCRERGVPFHCDAAQWIGKLPAAEFGVACDFVTGCAHKFGGPKAVGFLVVPEGAGEIPERTLAGGPQEGGRRAGTEDLPGILAMLAALRDKTDNALESIVSGRLADRRHFEAALAERLPGCRLVAPAARRLWNTVMFVAPRHPNLKWLNRLSAAGFCVSTGSACSAGRGNPSRVMEAMGLDHGEMGRVIRVSGGWSTAAEDWAALIEALAEVAADLDSGNRDAGLKLGGAESG